MKTKFKKIFSTKKIGILALCVIFFGGMISCEEDYLEKKPLDAISDAAVWSDIALTQAYVDYTSGLMKAGWAGNSRLCNMSDDGYQTEGNSAQLVQRGEVTPTNMGYLSQFWGEYYAIITSCNKFLNNVTGDILAELEAKDKSKIDIMTGEIKFLRAYSYFRLLAFYGGVPLVTEPFILGEDFMVPRDSYDDVLAFVLKELDEAAVLLPPSFSGSDEGRPTKGAAMSIKARALLYAASPWHNPGNDIAKWQKVADAAKAVIDLDMYPLFPNYKDGFLEKTGNWNNKEYIYRLVINQGLKFSYEYRIERKMFPNGSAGWGHPSPSQTLVNTYETLNGILPLEDTSYDPQDPYANRDPRFYANILYDGAPWQGREIEIFLPGGTDSPQGPEGWNASWSGYYCRKYADESINPPSNTNTSNPHWPFVRFTEMLLIYAEANFYLGNEDIAREYLNKVRSRPSVMMPDVLDTGADLEKRIRNERRVEFFMEEHRFFDIRRWKMEIADSLYRINCDKDVSTGVKTYSVTVFMEFNLPERMFLSPIPQNEIDKNPLLVQNPGY